MRTGFLFFLILPFVACKKDGGPANEPGTPLPKVQYLNVAYGTDPAQKMDIYLPAGRTATDTRFFILIHGGAWMSGDKTDFNSYIDTFMLRMPGWAIFNVNYRLATAAGNVFPTQENDIKAAVAFILGKTGEYHLSKRYVLLGASAGAHLALLQGYKNPGADKPKAIIDMFGPAQMAELYDGTNDPLFKSALTILLSGTPATNPAMYEQSSPRHYITMQSPPTLILQGGLDTLVPPVQSWMLLNDLQTFALGNSCHLQVYPTEGHGWTGANLTHSFNMIQAYVETVVP